MLFHLGINTTLGKDLAVKIQLRKILYNIYIRNLIYLSGLITSEGDSIVNILQLGIDYKKFTRYEAVTPYCIGTFLMEPPNKTPVGDDVVFCLAFVLDTVLEWQEIW